MRWTYNFTISISNFNARQFAPHLHDQIFCLPTPRISHTGENDSFCPSYTYHYYYSSYFKRIVFQNNQPRLLLRQNAPSKTISLVKYPYTYSFSIGLLFEIPSCCSSKHCKNRNYFYINSQPQTFRTSYIYYTDIRYQYIVMLSYNIQFDIEKRYVQICKRHLNHKDNTCQNFTILSHRDYTWRAAVKKKQQSDQMNSNSRPSIHIPPIPPVSVCTCLCMQTCKPQQNHYQYNVFLCSFPGHKSRSLLLCICTLYKIYMLYNSNQEAYTGVGFLVTIIVVREKV